MQKRATYYYFSLSRQRRLLITFRRFRASKTLRSKKYRQLIIPVYFGSIRQVAVRQIVSRPVGRPVKHQRQLVSPSFAFIMLGLIGATYFGLQVFAVKHLEPTKTFTLSTPATAYVVKPLPASTPTHLLIPSVGIDVSVTTVGKASDGSIQMPPLFDWTTGWYKYSPTPGQLGPAIIVGHVDTYKGISVFWRLRDVNKGDMIYVTRADGRTVVFKVSALKQFSQAAFPTQQVYGNIPYPGLRLITCGGAFDTSTASYTENTVVYAFMTKA